MCSKKQEPKQLDPTLLRFSEILKSSNNIVFFGGAGTSTESNIPDFRSKDGLYSTPFAGYEPEYLLSHDCLMKQPKLFYAYLKAKLNFPDARPNKAHEALYQLERLGALKAVVTQNIDNLHQAAGSQNVYELHGTLQRASCSACGKAYEGRLLYHFESDYPTCTSCKGLIRPNVTLYGEMLDNHVIEQAIRAISNAEVLIVGGTSLAVYPAAGFLEYFQGKTLILMNRDRTPIDQKAHLVIREPMGEAFAQAMALAFPNL